MLVTMRVRFIKMNEFMTIDDEMKFYQICLDLTFLFLVALLFLLLVLKIGCEFQYFKLLHRVLTRDQVLTNNNKSHMSLARALAL